MEILIHICVGLVMIYLLFNIFAILWLGEVIDGFEKKGVSVGELFTALFFFPASLFVLLIYGGCGALYIFIVVPFTACAKVFKKKVNWNKRIMLKVVR